MLTQRKRIALAVFIVAAIVLTTAAEENLTFEALKENSARLELYARRNYGISVGLLATGFFLSAFIIPGALILTVGGGYLFGAFQGTFYAALFSTLGSILAFFLSRYFIGNAIQKRYVNQLEGFNREMARRGLRYLFVLRVIPVMPFFAVNYLAGLTRISAIRFGIVTFLGLLPGALVYSMAGSQLQRIESVQDLLSGKILGGLLLLAFFSLLPLLYDGIRRLR